MQRACALLALPALAAAHGAMVIPRPRNAVDADIAPWNGSVPDFKPVSQGWPTSLGNWCPVGKGGGESKGDEDKELSGSNGQSCFWFSNGCSIGCPTCDGKTVGPSFTHNKTDICHNGMKPTLCDPALRTYGRIGGKWPACGGPEDRWSNTPWRAPGSAPVLDACGMAGGTPKESHSGAQYYPTSNARQGDLGTQVLPAGAAANTAVWGAGQQVEVSWAINANHGGGYSYRLCPKAEPLTESCFQRTPLSFVNGSQALRWDGVNGARLNISGQYVVTGTTPRGSSWAKNPIPRGNEFAPPCGESAKECGGDAHRTTCRCSGAWGPYNLEIVDTVQLPPPTVAPPGDYVLGWRWDCEESAQVWASCADVTITAAPAPPPPPPPALRRTRLDDLHYVGYALKPKSKY